MKIYNVREKDWKKKSLNSTILARVPGVHMAYIYAQNVPSLSHLEASSNSKKKNHPVKARYALKSGTLCSFFNCHVLGMKLLYYKNNLLKGIPSPLTSNLFFLLWFEILWKETRARLKKGKETHMPLCTWRFHYEKIPVLKPQAIRHDNHCIFGPLLHASDGVTGLKKQ